MAKIVNITIKDFKITVNENQMQQFFEILEDHIRGYCIYKKEEPLFYYDVRYNRPDNDNDKEPSKEEVDKPVKV